MLYSLIINYLRNIGKVIFRITYIYSLNMGSEISYYKQLMTYREIGKGKSYIYKYITIFMSMYVKCVVWRGLKNGPSYIHTTSLCACRYDRAEKEYLKKTKKIQKVFGGVA